MSSSWISYNDLAWTEELLADPAEYEYEAKVYIDLIKQHSKEIPQTLLHMGSGAGGHDYFFKQHFKVCGVDLSPGMLKLARTRHPELEYHEGDMRSIQLERLFDAVIIPDGIDYMTSPDDLHQAIQNAKAHLKPGGVLLIVGKTEEGFRNNNFSYTGEKENVQVTLLENNYVNPYRPNTYEATLVYLIREQGELNIHTDHQVLGLFPLSSWENLFREAELNLISVELEGIYDQYLMGEGAYPMMIFLGQKADG